jgi:hypothetical protein
VLVALGGAALIVVLGGLLSVSAGLLVVAGAIGWLAGRAMSTVATLGGRGRRTVAVLLAISSIAAGQVGLWLHSLTQGGALGLADYLAQTWGALVVIETVVAAGTAWWASR